MTKKISLLTSILIIFFSLIIFTTNSLAFSSRKPFWLDEIHSIIQTIQSQSYQDVIVSGPIGQGSPSPLDYLVAKTVYLVRQPFQYLHLQPYAYFRVQNLFYLYLTISIIAIFLLRYKTPAIFLIFCLTLPLYLFNDQVFYFASELRPYFLWVNLSLLTLFLIYFRRQHKVLWLITLILLSLSATASIYLIFSVYLALLLTKHFLPNNNSYGLYLNYQNLPLYLGALINIYYILHISSSGYPPPSWSQFFDFYKDFLPFIVFGSLLSLVNLKNKKSDDLIISLSATITLLLAPLSFFITQHKSFFFAPRQYIYFVPIIFALSFQFLKHLFDHKFHLNLLGFLLLILFAKNLVFFKNHINIQPLLAYHLLKQGQPISVPVNYQLLSSLVPYNIPAQYQLLDSNQLSATNFNLWWQYLEETYPRSQFPRDPQTVLVLSTRDSINFQIQKIKNLKAFDQNESD